MESETSQLKKTTTKNQLEKIAIIRKTRKSKDKSEEPKR